MVKCSLSVGLSPPGLQPPPFLRQAWMEESGTALPCPSAPLDGLPLSEDHRSQKVTPHGGLRPGRTTLETLPQHCGSSSLTLTLKFVASLECGVFQTL